MHLHTRIKICEVTETFCSSENQYVNSSNESCTLVEYLVTLYFIFKLSKYTEITVYLFVEHLYCTQ